MGYNRVRIIMSNGERILNGMNSYYSQKFECKDYPVYDDRWSDKWSHDSWQDSHRK